jgi:tetratricopeptide (TPR) repeat protein
VPVSDTVAGALLLQAGRSADAAAVLSHALASNPEDSEAEFLLGMIALAEMDYDGAIAHFRAILVREPAAERVRLELARAFFLKRDFDNAARQFRFARAGNLPGEVKANVDQYLFAIARLKTWSYDFSLALEEDSNINAATDLRQVDIFGLPFVLSADARKTSGRGISLDAGGEYAPLLGETTKARLGLRLRRAEFGGGAFDDMTVSAYAGPEFLAPRWQLVLLATGFTRWFGNRPLNTGAGARLGATRAVTGNVNVGLTLEGQEITYDAAASQDSEIGAIGLSVSDTLSPSSTLRAVGGFAARDARNDVFSSTTWWAAAGYYRDLPFGFSVYVEPAVSTTRYHAPLLGFGAARKDDTWSVRLDALNRRIDIRGFTPRFSVGYSDQSSTIALYDVTRTQFTVAMTRQF